MVQLHSLILGKDCGYWDQNFNPSSGEDSGARYDTYKKKFWKQFIYLCFLSLNDISFHE